MKDIKSTECQLAYFAQDNDLLSPHVMQTRNKLLHWFIEEHLTILWVFVN